MRRLLLVPALLCCGSLAADPFPTQERGFQAERAFYVGDFDTVNLFNGNLVLAIPIGGSYPVGGSLSYGLTLTYNSNVWDFQEDEIGVYRQALPNRLSNAGLGWRLSLGELLDPTGPENDIGLWTYVGADGGEHSFRSTLHEGEPVVNGVEYTRDGSYLRLRTVNANTRAVDFPAGMTQTFTGVGNHRWRLSRIEDRFGNWVNVSYTLNGSGEVTAWTIQDQHGRVQTVNFIPASHYGRVVGSVVLTAFGGATATYTFNYVSLNIPPACPHNDPVIDGYLVPFLSSVELPDGSSYSMPPGDYHVNKSVNCRLPGVLKAITTPLLGRIEWTYANYDFPAPTDERPWRNLSAGVSVRTLKDHSGTVVGTWRYTPALNPLPGPNQLGREAIRTVVTPLGDKTESYFSVALDDSDADWSKFDYGLPFSRFADDGAGRFLSTRVWDCDAGAVNCALKRSTYVTYERDQGLIDAGDFQANLDRNRRISATRTVYEDDGGKYEATVSSSFDGLGHYRQTDLSGSFDAGNTAALFTNYNANRGTYPSGFVMLNGNEPWVLDTYTEQTRTEGNVTARTEHCFDAATGFLLRTRTLKTGTARGFNDLVAVFTHSGGNLTREDYFGGDVQTVGLGELCGLSLVNNQYRIDHTWQYGVGNLSQYHDGAGNPLSFKSLDTDIDPSSGLVKKSRDTSLVGTSYEYDAMGRLTAAKPDSGHDGWTVYAYSRSLGAASPAQVQISRRPNGGGTALAESIIKYDSFGRVWQEQTKMPGGTWSVRETSYNALHWKTQVSELGNTSETTQYLNHDPFGRPAIIRPPDGMSHDVALSYLGVRKVSRTSKVGNSITGSTINEVLSTTQELYDRQGRLYQVKEQAETNGNDTTTTYSYDVGNRLSRVQQTAAAGTQNRSFTYDNRGFLTSEQHPEKGDNPGGNGTVTYSQYDARGHARRKIDGPNDLTFTYDRAERLRQVDETGGDPLKVFNYGASNAAGLRTNGRLESALRYNYVGTPFNATVLITETYAYGGRQGRASSRTTQMTFNGAPNESFSQSWTWNELGDLGSVTYPACQFAACVPAARTISPGYTSGFLTSVPGWGTLSYHPNGMVNQITHSNGVTDTQANDPDGMRRPSAISSAKVSTTLWSSGAYTYDGSGNVVKTGNGYFLYDRVSRLIEGRVYSGATGGGTQKWQSYSYDAFGNIVSIGGTSGRATPTSAMTNRLNGAGTLYDAAGNLTIWNGNSYQYDGFNQMIRMKSGAEDWVYVYTPGDERLWSYRVGGGASLWALRDLDGRILREYEAHTSWSAFKDYIYRGSQLLGSVHPAEGTRHFHLDHLGTPRLVTAGSKGGDFYTLAPCRVLDTRNQAAPLSAGETRTIALAGACGIPSTASAVSLNLTVIDATAQGELTAWPSNEPQPVASAISYQVGTNRANNGMLKLGNGALSFYANQPSGTAHLVLDVNGYSTEDAGTVLAYHVYYPFGEEATVFNQDTEQMKFTGHERDLASLAGAGDDLDYMHARHASPLTGRFLSMDPAGESFNPKAPQSWNRYAYVQGNPLAYLDPTGENLSFWWTDEEDRDHLEEVANQGLFGVDLKVDSNGNSTLQPNGEVGPPSPGQAALAGVFEIAINHKADINISLVSGDSSIVMGSYEDNAIDVQDVSRIGLGEALSSSSVLGHEISEQTAKQVFDLKSIRVKPGDKDTAHAFGLASQAAISGFMQGHREVRLDGSLNGTIITDHVSQTKVVTVTIYVQHGNVVRIGRQ
ncbi:MAG: RHS repeat-associated core domain-containing protein [Acidobacteriota bacterium]